jgi:hypothetical protein
MSPETADILVAVAVALILAGWAFMEITRRK